MPSPQSDLFGTASGSATEAVVIPTGLSDGLSKKAASPGSVSRIDLPSKKPEREKASILDSVWNWLGLGE